MNSKLVSIVHLSFLLNSLCDELHLIKKKKKSFNPHVTKKKVYFSFDPRQFLSTFLGE
jgi:hypothetical protein